MNLLRAVVLGVGVLAISAAGADDKPGKVDAKKLVGEWKITEGWKAGEKATGDATKGTIIVAKDMVTIKGDKPEETFEFSYKLNADKGEIDLEITKPEPLKGTKTQGIAKLEDGKFTLCYHPMGEKRPTEFKSTKENGFYMFVMEKKK
jgi:uncharacterized protein (TIGR03067 family)